MIRCVGGRALNQSSSGGTRRLTVAVGLQQLVTADELTGCGGYHFGKGFARRLLTAGVGPEYVRLVRGRRCHTSRL
jgi:hypothetical protein